jgi:hypothetical protein
MDYKNMSTEELARKLVRCTPDQRTKILAQITSVQCQLLMNYIKDSMPQEKDTSGENILAVVLGVGLFFVIWVVLGSLFN